MMHGEDDSQLLVTDLEYADDAALCASSPQQLQDLINSLTQTSECIYCHSQVHMHGYFNATMLMHADVMVWLWHINPTVHHGGQKTSISECM
jgi:hypothetical protein